MKVTKIDSMNRGKCPECLTRCASVCIEPDSNIDVLCLCESCAEELTNKLTDFYGFKPRKANV